MAKMEVRSGDSTRNSPTFQPLPSLGVGKGQHAAPTSPKTSILPTISPSPPRSASQMQNRPWPAVYKSALADKKPFVTYSTPKSGASVDLWKKVAKKAELELHLERNNHRADSTKDHHIIHRLSRRMIPMDKALGKSKATVKQQAKLIEDLKSKMLSASEKTEAELSYLRDQNQNMQRYLAVAAENNTGKITELEQDLRQANSSAEALKEQMDQIFKIVNDLPEVVNKHISGKSEKCTDRGLVVLANVKVICYNNEQLKTELRDRDEKLAVVSQENERLGRAADEAACRSIKVMNFVASLRQERDMAVIQLKKESEDMVESIKDLEDFVRSCTSPPDRGVPSLTQNPRTTSLHEPVPPQTLQSRPTVKQTVYCTEEKSKHLAPTEEKNPVPLFLAEAEDEAATDISAMRVPTLIDEDGKTVVYCKTMSREELRTKGVSLVATVHGAFRVLSSKLEEAQQTTASLKRENEELRSTILEAYEGLKVEKNSKCISPDECNVALLVAIRELNKSTEGLRKEKAVLESVKLQHEKKIMDLESQAQNLTLNERALLETMGVVKNVMSSSKGGQEAVSYVEGFPNRTEVQGESLTEFQEMIEKLIQENTDAFEPSKEDKELLSLKKLYAQSLNVSNEFQAEKNTLGSQLQDLKEHSQFLLEGKDLNVQSEARYKLLQNEKDVLESDLEELQNDNQNLKADIALKRDSLRACKNDLVEQRDNLGIKNVSESPCLDILKALKCTLEAANLGGTLSSNVSITSGEQEFSGVQEMARQLVEEVNEARSAGETLKEQTKLKEKELSELRGLYHESKSLCIQLQSDIDALEFAMHDLHTSVQCIKVVLEEGMNTSDSEEVERRKIFWKADGLLHEKVVKEVSSLLQTLKTAEKSFQEIENVLGIKGLPWTDLQSKVANILIFLKSLKQDRELASIALRGFKELLSFVKQHLKCMVAFLHVSNSSPVAEEYSTTLSTDEPVNFKEVVNLASDFREVVKVLPSLIQKIRKLKTENDTLPANLQALELENLAITCRSKEHQENLQRLRSSSQGEINHLKQQLAAVESLTASVSSCKIEYPEASVNNYSEGNRGGQAEQTPLLKGLVALKDELFVLRREKSGVEVKAGDLALQLVSEVEKGKDLARDLSIAEAHAQAVTDSAIAAEAAVQNLTNKIDALQKDLTDSKAEVGILQKKACIQKELLTIEKSKWATLLEDQRTEIVRLGGSDVVDHREKMRLADAAEKVKQVLSKDPQISRLQQSRGGSSRTSPFTFLTTFTVDLLVNGKIFNQLEVGGSTGGLCHGVIHYFSVSAQTGNITFAESVMPGSQSSNMVADVSLTPKDDQKLYSTEPGDVLGLQIKVSSIEDPTPREAMYNTSIVRTNQILDAIKGQMVESFTLWPDLVSCWQWEREKTRQNSWNLIGVRWRFLMKNIFPDLSESLQALAIPGSATRPRVSTVVAI